MTQPSCLTALALEAELRFATRPPKGADPDSLLTSKTSDATQCVVVDSRGDSELGPDLPSQTSPLLGPSDALSYPVTSESDFGAQFSLKKMGDGTSNSGGCMFGGWRAFNFQMFSHTGTDEK